MTMKKYLVFSASILFLLASLYACCLREAFTTKSSSGDYPSKLLLADWYPLHKPRPTFSDLGSLQYLNDPVFPAHSTDINNLRQWRKPNNGVCSRSEICGNFYDDRKITLPLPLRLPSFSEQEKRVNMYPSV